jgi:hypothetical protein
MATDLTEMQRIVASYINGIGDGQYHVQSSSDGQEVCLGLEVLVRLTYGSDGYLTVEVVDEMMQAVNAHLLDREHRYRLPLVHPNLFELLLAFFTP